MGRLLAMCGKEIAPPVRWSPSEWADQRRFLSQESAAEPGKWRTDRAPYQRGIMDSVVEPGLKEVVVMSSAQVGKTSIQECILGYFIDLKPCPILWVAPTLEMAETTSKDRLAPMFRDSPCFRGKVKDPRSRDSGNTLLRKGFPGGQLTLAGANSPSSLASRPIQILIADEVDRFPLSAGSEGDPVSLAKKRCTTFWNSLAILVSTPTIKDQSRIEKAWKQSDQRHYLVDCPHCGFEQDLIWENLRYDGKGTPVHNVDTVAYFCASCGTAIAESSKAEMLRTGRWQATAKSEGIAGFHLNELYSPWSSWRDVALNYEAAREDPNQYKVWFNTSLGLAIEDDNKERLDWEILVPRRDEADYSQHQIPEGVLLLTAGVDVQADRLECSLYGWGEGEEWWLICHNVFFGDPIEPDAWESLEAFLDKIYPHPLGGTIKCKLTCVDSGFLAPEVYRECLKRRSWTVVKGRSGDKQIVSAPSLQDVTIAGRKLKKGVKLHLVGVDQVKSVLLNRAKFQKVGPRYLHLPADIEDTWLEGFLSSEVQVKKHRGGNVFYVWEKVPGAKRNEPLDTTVYAFAAAHLCGLTRMDWKKLKRQVTIKSAVTPVPEVPVVATESEPVIAKKPGRYPKKSGQNWAKNW